jgi:BirA family transcriptional regulator, biotin operon repressor / biotin---[acetyl-CoA-carboxylase] ligase
MVTVDLEQALLLADLTAPARWDEVTGSTNATAMELAAAGTPEWTVVAAGHQTQGRGRLGRAWVDRPGGSLMVSIVLRPALPVGDAGILTLLAGAAWAGSARDLTGLDVRCKWPNDLVIDGRKLGGILAEAVSGGDGELAHIVIGSGINIVPPTDVRDAAGLGEAVDPTELLGGFLRRFSADYGEAGVGAAPRALRRWRTVSDTLGRSVRARQLDGEAVEGVALDVDEHGGLVVDTSTGLATVRFGEVEHLG